MFLGPIKLKKNVKKIGKQIRYQNFLKIKFLEIKNFKKWRRIDIDF